jgi:TPR repeat protein
MNNLGYYYAEQKNYKKMMKYYLMAIKKKYSISMSNLGYYYEEQKDYENMMKYYLMAIENGNTKAMNHLAYYYYEQKNYENIIKYYIMAGKDADKDLLTYIINYYIELNDDINIMHYCYIGLNNGHIIMIIDKVINYLRVEQILEIYILCCNSEKYDENDIEKIRYKMDIKYNDIVKYCSERSIKIYLLINKYIYCHDISMLISNY